MRKNEEETKMRCVDRKGNEIGENAAQGRVLKALYETAAGRILLGILVKPFVSKAGGFLLNQPVSKAAIAPFIKKNLSLIHISEPTSH